MSKGKSNKNEMYITNKMFAKKLSHVNLGIRLRYSLVAVDGKKKHGKENVNTMRQTWILLKYEKLCHRD